MTSDPQGDFVTLARVVKTQGRRGEVAVEVHSDVPDRFVEGMKLFALPSAAGAGKRTEQRNAAERPGENDPRRKLEIEDLWPHKGLLILKFRGIDSISDAEVLVGSELQVPSSERAALEVGWVYVSDLVGCKVFDGGREIGEVNDVEFGAGEAPLLEVKSGAGTHEIPYAEAYLRRVDLEQKRIEMQLPEGMLDLGAPLSAEEKKQQKDEARKH